MILLIIACSGFCKVALVLQLEQGQVQDCFGLLEVRKTLICMASGLLESLGK